MRLLKFVVILLIVGIALSAGLVVMLVVGGTAAAVLLMRRLLRSATASASARPTIQRPLRDQTRDGEIIEVSATEVPTERRAS